MCHLQLLSDRLFLMSTLLSTFLTMLTFMSLIHWFCSHILWLIVFRISFIKVVFLALRCDLYKKWVIFPIGSVLPQCWPFLLMLSVTVMTVVFSSISVMTVMGQVGSEGLLILIPGPNRVIAKCSVHSYFD